MLYSEKQIKQGGIFVNDSYNIEQLLNSGKSIRIKPKGYSMYPLFRQGLDEAVIEKADFSTLHRGDVVLYRRDPSPGAPSLQGILVLHRVYKKTADTFYMVGDNQTEIEGPLRPDQVRGKLVLLIRKGRTISVRHPLYRMLTTLWLFLLPCRPFLSTAAMHVKRFFRHILK